MDYLDVAHHFWSSILIVWHSLAENGAGNCNKVFPCTLHYWQNRPETRDTCLLTVFLKGTYWSIDLGNNRCWRGRNENVLEGAWGRPHWPKQSTSQQSRNLIKQVTSVNGISLFHPPRFFLPCQSSVLTSAKGLLGNWRKFGSPVAMGGWQHRLMAPQALAEKKNSMKPRVLVKVRDHRKLKVLSITVGRNC